MLLCSDCLVVEGVRVNGMGEKQETENKVVVVCWVDDENETAGIEWIDEMGKRIITSNGCSTRYTLLQLYYVIPFTHFNR